MKKSKILFLTLSGLTLTFIIGIYSYSKTSEIQPQMLIMYLLIGLIALVSIIISIRKMKEEKEGQPMEDEFTTQVKHKSGFYAYIASLYMWLFIFLFKDILSSDPEILIGGGILLSGVIGYTCKLIVKRELNEK